MNLNLRISQLHHCFFPILKILGNKLKTVYRTSSHLAMLHCASNENASKGSAITYFENQTSNANSFSCCIGIDVKVTFKHIWLLDWVVTCESCVTKITVRYMHVYASSTICEFGSLTRDLYFEVALRFCQIYVCFL